MADDQTFTQAQVDAMIAEQIAALKSNRDELLKEAKAAKTALKNYDGVDPDEFKRLKAEAEAAEQKKAAAEGDFATLKKQLVDNHAKELAARDARVAKLNAALERRLVEAELTQELVKAGAKPNMIDLLVLRGKSNVRVRETEDDFEQYVADARGNPLVADGRGTPMTLADLVGVTLKTQYPDAFNGTGSSGGGASKSGSGSAGSGSRVIQAGDNDAFLANLADIASGKSTVVMP